MEKEKLIKAIKSKGLSNSLISIWYNIGRALPFRAQRFPDGRVSDWYKNQFVEVHSELGFKVKKGDTFEKCKQIIIEEAEQGWRLKQVVVPFDEKTYKYEPYCYQIIFEREL